MAALKNLASGGFRIGGSDSLFKHYLLPYLCSSTSCSPASSFICTTARHREGKIDLGVVRMPIYDTQLEVRESIQLQDTFVADPTGPLDPQALEPFMPWSDALPADCKIFPNKYSDFRPHR